MQEEKEYVFVVTQKLNEDSSVCCVTSQELGMSPTGVTSNTTSLTSEIATLDDDSDGEFELDKREEEEDVQLYESVEMDQLPVDIPFLPALDASTHIMIHEGYSEAIMDAQHALDSRLLAYSQYQQMARPKQVLLTPRRSKPERFVMTARPVVVDRPVTVCMGWQRVSNIDSSSRDLLRVLEEEGVSYEPHDTTYSVKYLAPVLPFGDCLFLSMEQILLYTEECEPLSPEGIRKVATKFFLAHYNSSTPEEKQKIDKAIQNLYYPTLKGGWGVSSVQTRRFVARRSDKKMLLDKCAELQKQGYSWGIAAEAVYTDSRGLISVDDDPDNSRVAWGDDFVLEALATAYQRDIFVVLVGCGKMFFLPHRPRGEVGLEQSTICHSKGHAPWFLLMRLTGSDRGGDHYEPMLCERLRGDGSPEFGSIGD
ncbi:unnamed protein product [Peronospora belbahrii]|uniref:Uncharacterized protein n=1 Tax=Peronospora belbahrii TaxID=622444 RepID=A0AAU9L2H7_9STRA|nr:unnamed protein product [Peronospora belbahrii]CAH0521388.1 unnamed protein product [Peronospora belbahrii]